MPPSLVTVASSAKAEVHYEGQPGEQAIPAVMEESLLLICLLIYQGFSVLFFFFLSMSPPKRRDHRISASASTHNSSHQTSLPAN